MFAETRSRGLYARVPRFCNTLKLGGEAGAKRRRGGSEAQPEIPVEPRREPSLFMAAPYRAWRCASFRLAARAGPSPSGRGWREAPGEGLKCGRSLTLTRPLL